MLSFCEGNVYEIIRINFGFKDPQYMELRVIFLNFRFIEFALNFDASVERKIKFLP